MGAELAERPPSGQQDIGAEGCQNISCVSSESQNRKNISLFWVTFSFMVKKIFVVVPIVKAKAAPREMWKAFFLINIPS